MQTSIDISEVNSARDRISEYVKRTPLEHSESLSERLGTNVFVKYELFQKTGSFKVRGVFNKLLSITDVERQKGVVAVSGGNHGQATAYAAGKLGVRSVVVMPVNTPQNYLNAAEAYGAEVELHPTIADCFERVKVYQDRGLTLVHPFDDPLVVAGQATVGLEILDDLDAVSDVVVSIGGGGLAGGVAAAVKSFNPAARIWGVETVGADAMSQALAAGGPVTLPAITSIAKTLGAPYVSELTLGLAREYLESVTVVTDAEAVTALNFIAERLKVITEPAASCTLAAADRLKNSFGRDSHVVLIFCGGNVGIADVCSYQNLL